MISEAVGSTCIVVAGTVVSAVVVGSVVVPVVTQVAVVVIWGTVVVIGTVVVTGTVVVGGTVVVVTSVADVVTTGRTAFSSFDILLQAPAAHSTVIHATVSPIARPVLLFFVIINPSILVVVVVLRTTHNTTERRDMSIKKSQILPVALKRCGRSFCIEQIRTPPTAAGGILIGYKLIRKVLLASLL